MSKKSKETAKKNVLVEENKTEKVLAKVFGDPQKKILKRLEKQVIEINALGKKYEKMSGADLKDQVVKLKKKCVLGVTVLSILSAIVIVLEVVLMLS
mgnify:CR=1 FL=1